MRSRAGRCGCTKARRSSRDPTKKVTDLRAYTRISGVAGTRPRQQNQINAAFHRNERPKATRSLPQPTLDAIADDGISDLTTHGEPTARLGTTT